MNEKTDCMNRLIIFQASLILQIASKRKWIVDKEAYASIGRLPIDLLADGLFSNELIELDNYFTINCLQLNNYDTIIRTRIGE